MRRTPEATGRVLAVDYGRKRIGLALSDELGLTARPLETIVRANRRDDMRRLRQVVRQHGVRRVIVGHPLHLDGTAGAMAAEATRFAGRLRKELGLEVESVDERLTSWEADETLRETRQSTRRARKASDDVAAAVILREYLERKSNNGPAEAPGSE
ncbi:MAG: Holliday junction resolvase RuvX [Candidatus Acidiferrales bacterium]